MTEHTKCWIHRASGKMVRNHHKYLIKPNKSLLCVPEIYTTFVAGAQVFWTVCIKYRSTVLSVILVNNNNCAYVVFGGYMWDTTSGSWKRNFMSNLSVTSFTSLQSTIIEWPHENLQVSWHVQNMNLQYTSTSTLLSHIRWTLLRLCCKLDFNV